MATTPKTKQLTAAQKRLILDEKKAIIEQVDCLRSLLNTTIPIPVSIPGSEQQWESPFDPIEREALKRKLFKLLNKF